MGAFCSCGEDCLASIWLQRCQSRYKFTGEVLSSSPCLEVRVAVDSTSKERIAVKCFHKLKSTRDELRIARHEMSLMRTLSHPRLVRYISQSEDREWLYLGMELCEGGGLEALIRNRRLTEAMVKPVFQGVLEALDYLHKRGVCHRDIKPENILFTRNFQPKLADFGLAKVFSGQLMHSQLGTPYYLAPEVLSGNYSEKCDIWSAGVVLYYCLRGRRPFTSSIYHDLAVEILTADIRDWEGMTEKAVDLVSKMMEREPSKRPSAIQALRHPWFHPSSP